MSALQFFEDHCLRPAKPTAFGLTVFPFDWHLGIWRKPHKVIYSVGPFRFCAYYTKAKWKEA